MKDEKFSSVLVSENNIKKKKDLFGRGHIYKNIEIDNSYPNYLVENIDKYRKWID